MIRLRWIVLFLVIVPLLATAISVFLQDRPDLAGIQWKRLRVEYCAESASGSSLRSWETDDPAILRELQGSPDVISRRSGRGGRITTNTLQFELANGKILRGSIFDADRSVYQADSLVARNGEGNAECFTFKLKGDFVRRLQDTIHAATRENTALALMHGNLDLASSSTASLALIFIPFYALPPVMVGWLVGLLFDRLVWKTRDLQPG